MPLGASLLIAGWAGLIVWKSLDYYTIPWQVFAHAFHLSRWGAWQPYRFFSHTLSSLAQFGLLVLLLLAVFGWGRWVREKIFFQQPSRLDAGLVAMGLGFSLWSVALFLMGVLGLYRPGWVPGLILVSAGWGGWSAWQHRDELLPPSGWLKKSGQVQDRILAGVVMLALAWAGLNAFTPELFFDALVYHLAVPAYWIQSGGIRAMPYNFFSNLPMGLEILYGAALQIGDERLCRLLHLTLTFLGGLAIFSLGRRWFNRRVGWWAAGLFLTVPLIVMNMLSAAVDAGMVFYIGLALAGLLQWGTDPQPSSRRLMLTGWFIGAALGVKYTAALVLAPACLVVAGLAVWPKRGQRVVPEALLVAGTALVLVLPWVIKNTVYTGNPVYPFFYQFFPSEQIEPAKMQQQMDGFREYGKRSWSQWVRVPWDLTFYQPTSNSYVGPIFLLVAPGWLFFLWRWKRGPPVRNWLLAIAGLGGLLWATQTQIARYLTPLFPVLALLAAAVLVEIETAGPRLGRWVRWGVLILSAWGLANLVSIGVYHYDPLGVVLGYESRSAYLDRVLMNSYTPMARKVNQLPKGARVLMMGETRTFYFQRPVTAATVYDPNPFIVALSQAPSAAAVWQQWRQAGYTHLLVSESEAVRVRGYEPYRWDDGAVARLQELLSRYVILEAAVNRQRLYRLADSPQNQPVKTGRPLYTYAPEVVDAVMAHARRAQAAIQRNQMETVRAEWLRIAALAPAWPEVYLDLAWWYTQRGQADEAGDYYLRADALGRLDAGAYNNLGVHFLRHHQTAAARHYFQLALEQDPDLEIAKKNLMLLDTGELPASEK